MSTQGQILEGASGKRESVLRTLLQFQKPLELMLAFAVGWAIWHMPPPLELDDRGMQFLATLAVAMVFWVFEILDEYIVALMLLLSWLSLGAIPPDVALAGFSKSSWFFALAAVGIAAAVTKVGLLRRLTLMFLLKRIPPNVTIYNFILASAGVLATPLLPNVKARIAIMLPASEAVCQSLGLRPLSNASAGLALSAYVGFSQMSFMFLTGTTSCLIGWNLLSEDAKQQFGWGTWALAALPAGIFTFVFIFLAIHFLFPPEQGSKGAPPSEAIETQLKSFAPLSGNEYLTFAVLLLALFGWLAKPIHGINEAWVALGCFLIFLITGIMDKKDFKSSIDWGFLFFFGTMSSLGVVVEYLKVDRWLMSLLDPVLSASTVNPVAFLMVVLFIVYFVRLFLHKAPTVILLIIGLVPWAESLGIHPGVLLVTILLGIECWFLPYQTDSYLIAYYGGGEKAFSHSQGRKLMLLKFVGSFLALLISIPYWKMLGLIA